MVKISLRKFRGAEGLGEQRALGAKVKPERFKTRAAHFPVQRDERTDMERATLGKSGSEEALKLQGRTARPFSSNGLVYTMEMMAAIQQILTAAQS